jgi:hypothetical protein
VQENKSAAKAVNKNFYKNKEILSHSHLSLFLDNEKTDIIRNSRSGFFRFPIKSSFIAANMISPKLHSLRFSFDKNYTYSHYSQTYSQLFTSCG